MWEKRYDLFSFARNGKDQRIYSGEELKRLLRLAFLYHNGWKITAFMTLSDEDIEGAVERIAVTGLNYQTFALHLLHAAVDLNEAAFINVLDRLVKTVNVERTIVEVCYPHLLRLHALCGKLTAGSVQERFSTYLIQTKLIKETSIFSPSQNEPPELVLFSPEKEANELPLLFLNYVLRKSGWTVFYLGQNNKLSDLKSAADLPSVFYLYMHLTESPGFFIDDHLETLRKAFPGKIIFASGKGIDQSQRNFLRVYLLRSDEAIYRMICSKKQIAKAARTTWEAHKFLHRRP